MRRIRLAVFALISFVAATAAVIFHPGTVSIAACTIFSFKSTLCTANLVRSSDRVVAANPPAVEKRIFALGDGRSKNSNNLISQQVLSDERPVYVYYVNGIRTRYKNYQGDLTLIKNFFGESGIEVSGVYGSHNPTGISFGLGDLIESIRQDLSRRSTDKRVVSSVVNGIKKNDAEAKRSQNCPTKNRVRFLVIGHSQGTYFVEDIANEIKRQNLPEELGERVSFLTISPFTTMPGIPDNKKRYLLRSDDLVWVHGSAGIAKGGVPQPNLGDLPNIEGIHVEDIQPFHSVQSHRLDYYIGSETNNKVKFRRAYLPNVEEARNKAIEYIKDLLNYPTGKYREEKDCSPRSPQPTPPQPTSNQAPTISLTVTGPNPIRATQTTTLQVSYTEPSCKVRSVRVSGYTGLSNGESVQVVPPESACSGTFKFGVLNRPFFGCHNEDIPFKAAISDGSIFSIAETQTPTIVKLIGFRGAGDIAPCSAVPAAPQ